MPPSASQWSWLQLFPRIVASLSMVRWWQCQFLGPEKRLESGLNGQKKESQPETLGEIWGLKQQVM